VDHSQVIIISFCLWWY